MKQKQQSNPAKYKRSYFKSFLLHNKPEFKRLSPAQQDYMAFMVSNIAEGSIENKTFEGTYCAFFQPRYEAFVNNDNFLNKNGYLGDWLIKVEKGKYRGNPLGLADGWTISQEARELYNEFISQLNHKTLPPKTNFKGEAKPKMQNGLRSYSLTRHPSAFAGLFMPYEIEINLEGIRSFREYHLERSEKRSAQIVADCNFISTSAFIEGEKAFVYQQYIQYPSGRLYLQGKSLQTVCKEVKEVAFKGHYDYDFENCHYEIVRQLGDLYGLPTENLTYYCNNKSLFRQKLADQNQVDIKTAKVVLLSLIYGAKLSKDKRLSIYLSILEGSEMEEKEVMDAIGRMQKDPMLKNFIKELRQIRNAIFHKHKIRKDGVPFTKSIFNVFGTKAKCELNPDNVSLAHVVQGYEALMLKVVLELCGESLRLLQHDGFVSSDPIDTEMLSQAIFEQTGFRMKITSNVF